MVDLLEPEDNNVLSEREVEPLASSLAPCIPDQDDAMVFSPKTVPSPEPFLNSQEPCKQLKPVEFKAVAQNTQPEELKLHLDLYNFDSPAAEGSRYVLTSPRSLEACARCGVKPVELLSRPLSDFAREAPGRSMRVATGMFEIYERDRHAKLRQCREERERIIKEEKRRILQAALNNGSQLASEKQANSELASNNNQDFTGSKLQAKKVSLSATSKCTANESGQSTSVSVSNSPSILKSSTSHSDQTTKATKITIEPHSQSKRPKSATRLSNQSLNHGSKKPPSASTKVTNTYPRTVPKPAAFPKTSSSLAPIVAKSAAHSPSNGTTNTFSQHNGHVIPNSKVRYRSHSLESLQRRRETFSSSTASTTNTTTTTTCTSSESASSTCSWDGTRDSWAKTSSPRARTLATFNSLMGRSLSLGDLSHSPQTTQKVQRIVKEVKRRGLKAVPERDRKIAALMLARYQEEDIMSQTRLVAHLQWDSERRLEEMRRGREDRDKQRAVQQCQRAWQSQVHTRQQWLNLQEREATEAKLRQVAENKERWRELAEQQERGRLLKLQQAAREEKHKKALQEQNLKALEDERVAILEQEKLLLKEKLTIAELKRQEREHQLHEERRGLNRAEKRRHVALIQEIARREADDREEVRRTAEEKLSRSLENYEQLQEKRGQELKEKARREEKQIQKARRVAEQREHQQKEQMESRAREAERRAQHAAQVAEERAREKAKRAVLTRREKERLQRLNRQRVEEEEKQRRVELLQSIERKLEKSEQIFKEKRAVLETARSVARASFHVRDRVREETNMRTFDKMALDAQLTASLVEK